MTKRKKKPAPAHYKPAQSFLNDRRANFILIIFSVIALVMIFDPKIFTGGDNGVYISLARSLRYFGTYRVLWQIGGPVETSQPPGYPLVLAFFMLIFGENLLVFKLFSFITFIVGISLLYRLWRLCGIGIHLSLGIAIFHSLNCDLTEFSHWELTEAPFFALYIATMFLFIQWQRKANKKAMYGAFILAIITFYIRPTGLPILAAIFFSLLLSRHFKELVISILIFVAMLLPWLLYNILMGQGILTQYFSIIAQRSLNTDGETASFTDLTVRVWDNLQIYVARHLPAVFFPSLKDAVFKTDFLGYLLGLILLIVSLLGCWRVLRQKNLLFLFCFLFYCGMLLVWPSIAALLRYLVILSPVILLLFVWGFEQIMCWLNLERLKKTILGILAGLMLISALLWYIPNVQHSMANLFAYLSGNRYAGWSPNFIRFVEVNEWLKNNSLPEEGVISRKPTLSYLFSGHPAQNYLYLSAPLKVLADIDSSRAKYVIVDCISSTTPQFLIPALQSSPQHFKVIYVTKPPKTYVLEILNNK